MSSESEGSSIEEDPQHSRLTHIWRSIQQTKNLSKMFDQPLHPLSHHNQNLVHLLMKVQTLEQENKQLKYQLSFLENQKQQQISNLRREFESKLRSHQRKMKTAEKQNTNTQTDQTKVDSQNRQIERLHLKIKSMEMDKRIQDAQLAKAVGVAQVYQADSDSNLQVNNQGRGQQLLELQQARQTIERLVELLKKTEDYRELGSLLQDSKNLHYLRNVLKRLKGSQLISKPTDKKQCSCQTKIPEKLLWSPTQCYKTMLEMKLKYDYLSEDCVEEVLFQMNKIYSNKEEKAIQRLKQAYETEITKLRKQLELGYDDFLAKKQLNRLKKELRVVKSTQKRTPKLEQLKDKGQLADQLKLRDKEIKLLRERVKLFETQSGFNDKTLYYEGTLWAIDRILGQLQSNQGALKQFQIKFRQRLDQNTQPDDWLRCYKQFFQSVEELGLGLAQRMLSLKEAALRKIGKPQ